MKNRTKLVVVSYVGRVALGGVLVAAYSWLPPAHATGIAAMAMMACVGIAAMCSVGECDRLDRLYAASLQLKDKLDKAHWTDAHIRPSPLGGFVAYDEAGLEHSRHGTKDEARQALALYAKTLENNHE
jgi:hypothetical protein